MNMVFVGGEDGFFVFQPSNRYTEYVEYRYEYHCQYRNRGVGEIQYAVVCWDFVLFQEDNHRSTYDISQHKLPRISHKYLTFATPEDIVQKKYRQRTYDSKAYNGIVSYTCK